MRERTPSADDTPKRAPPAPPREAAAADVAGSKTSSEALDVSCASKFPSTTSTATAASSLSSVDSRMVASAHNLDELGVSASGDRQQQQEKHGYGYRSAQTAQDKRSRLSNVINNLRKKVPDSRNEDSPRKEEDDRNSVERNLETLEKYVMTVLNGVIKDEEEDDREAGRKKEVEKGKEPEKLAADQEDEDSKGPAAKFEPSKPNESRTEAAVFPLEKMDQSEAKESHLEYQKAGNRVESSLENGDANCLEVKDKQGCLDDVREEKELSKVETMAEEEIGNVGRPESQAVQEAARNDGQESRSLGTIIMERLSENQSDEKQDCREFGSDNAELRNVCRDLLNDLLNDINQLIDESSQQKEESKIADNSLEESREPKESRGQEFSMTSLHCSLPLDKVASVLQNCQSNESTSPQSPAPSSSTSQGSKSPCKPPSPTVRHCLCLYCDRKFMSISLRQRHTERVHQLGGGRRPERNSRKSLQNCQYCSDKCAESLEGLFQHMVGSHGDKYYGCLQCSTRYLTREALAGHMTENHSLNADRNLQTQEKTKEPSPCKEPSNQSPRPDCEHRTESILLKTMLPIKENFSNPGSPEFDSSFYSSVSCNIRENLLHHLDGKLQSTSSTVTSTSCSIIESKPQQQQAFYSEHSANQIQLPIDISLTAATPVYTKDYGNKEYENSSEYAQKPGKSNRSHPRRVSFEKYNFPRKYDGKEQWTCSIKDLSNFDISTQLSLRKKQQLLKERLSLNRFHQIPGLRPSETTEILQEEKSFGIGSLGEADNSDGISTAKNNLEIEQMARCESLKTMENVSEESKSKVSQGTEFSVEFGSFLRLRKWDEKTSVEAAKKQEIVYAELTGEWSRPRIYICGACASKHVTLKELEDHKVISHPNVWCSHFEFSGDQRELYKHLFLPGKDVPTAKAKAANLAEKVCTKCSKNCNALPELHRHMLECGGDQTWLLGLFGNGKKKCKWRPFGSRSRRRRQRGMKRNIQNSQAPRVNTPKEKQPTGPRVRPSDRESIQKMLANLPPKRATRKVLQDSSLRTQGRLRNVQTRTRPRMVGENSSVSRMSRNKAALRNKLLKNAKSIQRNRCRIDNISAVIESVVKNYAPEDKRSEEGKKDGGQKSDFDKETKEKAIEGTSFAREYNIPEDKGSRGKLIRGPRVLGKRRNVKTKEGYIKSMNKIKRAGSLKAKTKGALKNLSENKADASDETAKAQKSLKVSPKVLEKETEGDVYDPNPGEEKSPSQSMKNKSFAQTTPKRKRPVDPVASLNASIKAKSQLRTQDGKFARNPNKESPSPPKSSPEMKSPVSGRAMLKTRGSEVNSELSVTRSKFKGFPRSKSGEQLPKRTTRLSSDSDKMPTLEPVAHVAAAEQFAETSANDLPILSPATSASGTEKALRGKSLNLDAKDNCKRIILESELLEKRSESSSTVQEEEKDQKQGKGRKHKNEVKNLENEAVKCDASKETAKTVVKERFRRKNALARGLEEKKGASKSPEEIGSKRESKRKEEEKLETRNCGKAALDNFLDEDSEIKIQNVPFEVKKLIGSDSKEDLLTKLVLTSRVTASKRCLRQPVSKAKPDLYEGKVRRELELEKSKLDSGSTSDLSRKEKFDARRKSLRNTDRKDKLTGKDDRTVTEHGNEIRDATTEAKTTVRRRRSSNSLSNDNKAQSSDSQNKIEAEAAVQNSDKRQTRGLNSENEVQNEVGDLSVKKNTAGRRRGRVKSGTDSSDKKNSELLQGKTDEPVDKKCSEQNELIGKAVETNNKQEQIEREQWKVPNTAETNATSRPGGNLSNLQVETNNSVDSGKENSLQTPAPVQKLKVGRPRKSWGTKKERTTKRSLNSVIGILTEGINIPVESQKSALNAQTNIDSSNSNEFLPNNTQTLDGNISKSENLDKCNKSSENGALEATSNSDKLAEEASSVQISSKEDPEKVETSEAPTEDGNAGSRPASKEQSPTNDIILDLSRRKQKGKGSFLEKIVSKIAKQKDALLEGEVGSLLDTAADELTSILDEVGPTFSENTESSSKGNVENKNRTSIPEEVAIESSKDSSVASNNSGNSEIQRSKLQSAESIILGEESLNETKKAEEIQEETCTSESKVQEELLPTEVASVLDTTESMIVKNVPELSNSDSRVEESAKKVEEVKTKRKSKRRSLEESLPRKNKRRPVELADSLEENQSSKELLEVASLIEKSKQVPFTAETIGNDSSSTVDVSVNKIQCGKRKSSSDEPESNGSPEDKAVDDIQTVEDPSESIKKFKVDSNGDRSINAKSIEDIDGRSVENSVENQDEERSALSMKISGKRKSCVEVLGQHLQAESPIRRSCKRRSGQEEKTSAPVEEDTEVSKIEESSSISKSMEKILQHSEDDSASSVGNVAAAESSENGPKNCGPSKEEDLEARMREKLESTGENSQLKNKEETVKKDPVEEPPVVPKVPKKRGRKKKCLSAVPGGNSDSKTGSTSELEATSQLPPRRSLRTNKINEESEDQNKHSNDPINLQVAPSSLEPFKVPEVTEILQHTKKRSYKRKSATDGSSEGQNNCPSVDSDVMESQNIARNPMEKEEQAESSHRRRSSEGRKRVSRDSSKEQLDLQRSNSSESIDLARTSRTRSSKRKQLSSEDLSGEGVLDRRAESADNLSETSCISESSYFRKKRFSKKKKELQRPAEEVQTDTSITDSESVDAEKNTDRRQSLKRRAKKNISFLEDLLFLVDGFDIPMDIQDCISREDIVESNVSEPVKPSIEDNGVAETGLIENPSRTPEKEVSEEKEQQDLQKLGVDEKEEEEEEEEEEDEEEEEEEEEEGEEEDGLKAEDMDDKVENLSQSHNEFQVPKKRTAGNYVVVHKKTGEILIVEKRKKLTKEAARFFCDVCTTSFTRKSSLKKHNQSQSHLIQMAKHKKGKTSMENNENPEDTFNLNQNDVSGEENPVGEVTNVSAVSTDDQKEPDTLDVGGENNLELRQEDSCYPAIMEQTSLIGSENSQQHTLEDELLDEEICKITENMSHDEYVLTDHVSPEPDIASTPIKLDTKKEEDLEKKLEKGKKKIQDVEQIELNSPELEIPRDSTLVSVLGTNMSIKITKCSQLNVPKYNSKDILEKIIDASNSFTDSCQELKINSSVVQETALQNGSLDPVLNLHEEQGDLDMKIMEHNLAFSSDKEASKSNTEEETENFSKNNLEQPKERLNLKFTISKHGMEPCKEMESESNRSAAPNYSSTSIKDNEDINLENKALPMNEDNISQVEIDEATSDLSLFKVLKAGSERSLESTKVLDVSVGQRTREDATKLLDPPVIVQTTEEAVGESKTKTEKPSELLKTSRHGKSKREKIKKHLEEMEDGSSSNISKKLSKPKDIQSKVCDVAAQISKATNGQNPVEHRETFNNSSRSGSPLNVSYLEHNSPSISRATSPEKLENELEYNELKIVREQNSSARCSQVFESKENSVENIGSSTRKNESFHLAEDDEASSSSSLADKPLSQILLERGEKLEQARERKSSLNVLGDSKGEAGPEERTEVEGIVPKINLEFDVLHNSAASEKSDELMNDEQTELQIVCEEEDEVDALGTPEDSDKESKIQSESENSETVRSTKIASNEKELCDKETIGNDRKSCGNSRQNARKKLTRTPKYSNNYRKPRGKRSVRNQIAGLTSDSDDSETEDKIKSENKSRIVKSVFGRVFGGEKTDKVKEVLNDWVSKSEDDSEASRTDFGSSSPVEGKVKESVEERNGRKHSVSSSISSPNLNARLGRKSKKSSTLDKAKENSSSLENQEEHRAGKHGKSKTNSSGKKKHDAEASNGYFQILPSTKCRPSKKRAEELISRSFENDIFESDASKNEKSCNHKEATDELNSQSKPDLTIKDSGYGSFNYDNDSSKMISLEDPTEDDEKIARRRKSFSRKSKCKTDDEDWSDLIVEKKSSKISKECKDKGEDFAENLAEAEPLTNVPPVDPEFSQSCSSLAPSSVRNRSPSMDRNSQTTRDSDVEEEEDDDMGHRRISPLFVCGTPRSSIRSSSNSENEEEDENVGAKEAATRKRSSSEFSGEKIVIRSPSSAHKGEMVTIAPTDAIEDNALDVPQEIETAKPRQGKVLNFDEELFVECCSRLKATTENELRGAKKIKLDHNEGYHRKDEQQQGFRGPRDRWRDVESQNSLGSLLESVNQLLGEEMYSTRERDYPKRASRNLRSEHSSRSASPDVSRVDNLGYEDSLDVAFEHNNKLRHKIQQRMRESENLIASTFGQKSTNETVDVEHPFKNTEQDILSNSYSYLNDQRHAPATNLLNGGYSDALQVRSVQEQQSGGGKVHLDSPGLKSKMNSSLGGLLDKALSNLLHSNEKHDHNGSTPMKVLAELACARAPTSTAEDSTSHEAIQPLKISSVNRDTIPDLSPATVPKDLQKKPKNPIKELFEKKKEMNERKQQEKLKTEAALRELNVHRQRKIKKTKKHQEFPLIRRNELGGLAERKKRRDGFEKKDEFASNRIKDVYEFDEEESQIEPNLGSVMSYRNKPGYEVSCLKTKDVDVAGLMSKAIGDSLENGKAGDALSTRLESMIDRKFKELEKFAPKTKGALKAFQSEDHQQQQVTGPMDEFVERKPPRSKKTVEPVLKPGKLKKRSRNSKKKARNAWYENDSSDEYRTAIKAEDVGVGISKSQRTCSIGKQNIFAELYTSSESEYEDEGVDYESRRQRRVKKTTKKPAELENSEQNQESINKYSSENEDRIDWRNDSLKSDAVKHDSDNKKSESEMSDHPLVIDERKDPDEQRNSDEETENQYERNYGMDDLYREDSSIVDSDVEERGNAEQSVIEEAAEAKYPNLSQEKTGKKMDYVQENELIPLEEALDLLDQADSETPLETKYENRGGKLVEHVNGAVAPTESEEETFKPVEQAVSKSPLEEQEEESDNVLLSLPEKLSSNEKPQKESENLPLHVFLSRKVQESKKRKEQQLKKMQEEQERILMDFQPTRRQRKCAIGKQGLLAEISSSDEELSPRDGKFKEKSHHEKPRKQKRESKEKRKERYIEKKHEQMIAKEQKAIEEEILRELEKKKESQAHSTEAKVEASETKDSSENMEPVDDEVAQEPVQKRKHQAKEKQRKQSKLKEDPYPKANQKEHSDTEKNEVAKFTPEIGQESLAKQKKHPKSPSKTKRPPKTDVKVANGNRRNKNSSIDRKNKTDAKGSRDKERRSSSGKRDSGDEELKTTKSWNKVEEGVGVAIGRRKRAAANQLYYWSSSSDEEELFEVVPAVEEEEDDRQEQHGWIVGDSHKRMITMLAMEKQLKEKRRRSEDEFEPGKAKSKKHRNSTS